MARKSGSIRVLMKLTSDSKVTSRRVRLKSAKNLCFGYRFFAEIRQIHRFFYVFRQSSQILCRNQARLIQTLQVGDCFEKTTFSFRAQPSHHAPHAAFFSPRATRHTHLARPSAPRSLLTARCSSRIEVNKTTALPAIFKQHLNKNFY